MRYTAGMNVVLATGIYPPAIGGPATYVRYLAEGLVARGVQVTVVTYTQEQSHELDIRKSDEGVPWSVIRVSKKGGPFLRWWRYAQALREHAAEADIVYCFSSVSCGIPLWIARLRHPRRVLRLGGDFLWERFTDRGGVAGLRDWYGAGQWFQGVMNGILVTFDHIVFSTLFQEQLYEKVYQALPIHSVIENALPSGVPVLHVKHDPFRLLFFGRFVAFKNIGSLLMALLDLPTVTLTLVGEGPLEGRLRALVAEKGLSERVTFLPPQSGEAKRAFFLEHDLLVLPSLTEISPNAALEARVAGLPILLTQETGFSQQLLSGVQLRILRSPRDIVNAVREVEAEYSGLADRAAALPPERGWDHVCDEHLTLFRSLL